MGAKRPYYAYTTSYCYGDAHTGFHGLSNDYKDFHHHPNSDNYANWNHATHFNCNTDCYNYPHIDSYSRISYYAANCYRYYHCFPHQHLDFGPLNAIYFCKWVMNR